MRRAEQIVGKSTARMRRDMSRVESGVSRQAGGAAARGARGNRLAGVGGRARDMVKGAAVMGGIYGIGAEVKKAKQFEEVLVDVAVRGSKNKQWMDNLRGSMIAISNEYGIAKDQLADYVGTIIDQTGNTELATKTLRSMTAVAYSANVPMKELAGTVVEMQSKLGLAPKEFETALGVLAAQADKGKVPLNQMSTILPEVLNSAGQFGHTGVRALRDYGAVLQMAARGAGSLAEANTAMNRMLDQVVAKRGQIEKTLGIKLKKNGAWLQLGDMLKTIVGGLMKMKAAGKDVEGFIVKTFGIRGKKAMLPMLQQGMIGWGNKVGSKGGKGGLTSFDALVGAGGAGTIQDRVARKRKLSPELDAWNKGVERLKNKLHMHLLPAIKKLGDIIPTVSRALEWMIDNWRLLLVVWGSGKMLKFFNTLTTAASGGAGMIGGIGKMLGGGAAAGGATAGASGGAGAAAGAAGGLIPALSVATTALGAFAASMAPAIAGLHELGKGYTKEGRKEKLAQLRRLVSGSGSKWGGVSAGLGSIQNVLEGEGLAGGLGYRTGETQQQREEIRARQALGVSRSQTKGLQAAWQMARGKKFGAASQAFAQFGTERLQKLAGRSEYELKQVGLEKRNVEAMAAYAKATSQDINALKQGWTTLGEVLLRHLQSPPQIVDPTKTASGVTESRRGSQ